MAAQVFNYAAKARRFIEGTLVGMHKRAGLDGDAHSAEFIGDLIGHAIHFHLPDSGRILDDELRGLWGEEVRLPYPIVTIEYRAAGETMPGGREVIERLAVAYETTVDAIPWAPAPDVSENLWTNDRRCIVVIPLSGAGSDTWTIDPIAVAMPVVPVFSPDAVVEADLDVTEPPDYFRREPGKRGCVMAAAGLIVQPGVMEKPISSLENARTTRSWRTPPWKPWPCSVWSKPCLVRMWRQRLRNRVTSRSMPGVSGKANCRCTRPGRW